MLFCKPSVHQPQSVSHVHMYDIVLPIHKSAIESTHPIQEFLQKAVTPTLEAGCAASSEPRDLPIVAVIPAADAKDIEGISRPLKRLGAERLHEDRLDAAVPPALNEIENSLCHSEALSMLRAEKERTPLHDPPEHWDAVEDGGERHREAEHHGDAEDPPPPRRALDARQAKDLGEDEHVGEVDPERQDPPLFNFSAWRARRSGWRSDHVRTARKTAEAMRTDGSPR